MPTHEHTNDAGYFHACVNEELAVLCALLMKAACALRLTSTANVATAEKTASGTISISALMAARACEARSEQEVHARWFGEGRQRWAAMSSAVGRAASAVLDSTCKNVPKLRCVEPEGLHRVKMSWSTYGLSGPARARPKAKDQYTEDTERGQLHRWRQAGLTCRLQEGEVRHQIVQLLAGHLGHPGAALLGRLRLSR